MDEASEAVTIDWTHPGTWLFVTAFVVLPLAVLAWSAWVLLTRPAATEDDERIKGGNHSLDDPPSSKAS